MSIHDSKQGALAAARADMGQLVSRSVVVAPDPAACFMCAEGIPCQQVLEVYEDLVEPGGTVNLWIHDKVS